MDTKRPHGIRCGWCIGGDHAHCATAIRMAVPGKPGAAYTWRCPCDQQTSTGSCKQVRQTRCVNCLRRGVDVTTDWSECIDVDDCRAYREVRRTGDPASKVIDAITAEQVEHGPRVRAPREAKVTSGECLCCGGATRGGKFLPGHDARFVSEQAAAYVAEGDPEVARTIYAIFEGLSPALLAKFVKRVEKVRADAKKEAAE